MTKKASPSSPSFKNCFLAFISGGVICTIGQILTDLYQHFGLSLKDSRNLVSVTLVFLGALLTALHIYDNIAKHAGAGTLVPITGFANSIVAPALEFKSEGHIMGIGAKMFIIAGPVIVFGVTASIVYGIIIWFLKYFIDL
ncbi:MAG: stage V sporulation protein AC [Clostridia bacterium]|nr:stage V sporulation protein AC [Clostridia bacterium]